MPKISQLPSAQPLSGSETLVFVQGGATVRGLASSISVYISSTTLSSYALNSSMLSIAL
jgi:hypothetical protein